MLYPALRSWSTESYRKTSPLSSLVDTWSKPKKTEPSYQLTETGIQVGHWWFQASINFSAGTRWTWSPSPWSIPWGQIVANLEDHPGTPPFTHVNPIRSKNAPKRLQHGLALPFAQGFPCFRSFSCSKDRNCKLLVLFKPGSQWTSAPGSASCSWCPHRIEIMIKTIPTRNLLPYLAVLDSRPSFLRMAVQHLIYIVFSFSPSVEAGSIQHLPSELNFPPARFLTWTPSIYPSREGQIVFCS